MTQNLILLIFKFYVYRSRGSRNLIFSALLHKLVKIENLEKVTVLRNRRKLDVYEKKWSFIENALQSEKDSNHSKQQKNPRSNKTIL